jgi:hypothetical protein
LTSFRDVGETFAFGKAPEPWKETDHKVWIQRPATLATGQYRFFAPGRLITSGSIPFRRVPLVLVAGIGPIGNRYF